MREMAIEVGDKAPDFELKDNHGRTVRLSDFRGEKAVVLLFYPFAFTGVCTGELCELRDQLPRFQNDDVQLLAVSNDSVPTLRVFGEQEGWSTRCCRTSGRTGRPRAPTASSTRTRDVRSAAPSSSTRTASCAGLSSTDCPTRVT